MPEELNLPKDHHSLDNTDMAFERTVLAYERTLMAWIRTSTSLISFGFTLYKFFHELHKTAGRPQQLLTPRIAGMLMILFGIMALLLAQIQHNTAIRRLKKDYPLIQFSLSSLLSTVMLLFGLGLFLAALFRQ